MTKLEEILNSRVDVLVKQNASQQEQLNLLYRILVTQSKQIEALQQRVGAVKNDLIIHMIGDDLK